MSNSPQVTGREHCRTCHSCQICLISTPASRLRGACVAPSFQAGAPQGSAVRSSIGRPSGGCRGGRFTRTGRPLPWGATSPVPSRAGLLGSVVADEFTVRPEFSDLTVCSDRRSRRGPGCGIAAGDPPGHASRDPGLPGEGGHCLPRGTVTAGCPDDHDLRAGLGLPGRRSWSHRASPAPRAAQPARSKGTTHTSVSVPRGARVSVLQRDGAKRMYVPVCTRHAQYVHLSRNETSYQQWAHEVIEAEKSHDVPSAGWRPGGTDGINPNPGVGED